jgi:hypothetical protein
MPCEDSEGSRRPAEVIASVRCQPHLVEKLAWRRKSDGQSRGRDLNEPSQPQAAGGSQLLNANAGRKPKHSRRKPPKSYLGSIQAVKITLEEALALLGKYAEERTSVLAVVGSPSRSIARVTGPIRVSLADGVSPHLIVGKEDDTSDQIKFRLSDCMFEYGEFGDDDAEDSGDRRFEAFLVVGSSKGDTLSLFEPKS